MKKQLLALTSMAAIGTFSNSGIMYEDRPTMGGEIIGTHFKKSSSMNQRKRRKLYRQSFHPKYL